jgi:hypothetical protein
MMMIRHALTACLLLMLSMTSLKSDAQQAPNELSSTARLTLQKEATLEEVVRAVHKAAGGVVVSELIRPEKRLRRDLKDVPLVEALDEVSESFDLYWRARPGGIVLNRRFMDPADLPDVSVEELAAALGEAHRLITPFSPYTNGRVYTENQNSFAQSLSSGQMRRMREEGLPFMELSPAQQDHWLIINAAAAYKDPALILERGARLFGHWGRAYVSHWPPVLSDREPPGLGVYSPDYSVGGFAFGLYCGQTDDLPTIPASGRAPLRGELLGPREPSLPRSFQARVGSLKGEMSLREAVAALARASSNSISAPSYADEYRLLVYASEARAAALAAALEDVRGWEARPSRGRRWVFDRPRFQPASDDLDLHGKLIASIPISLRLLLRADGEMVRAIVRNRLACRKVSDELTRLWPEGKPSLQVADLPPDTRRKLANYVFAKEFRGMLDPLKAATPPWWVVAPRQGVFRMDGRGSHPMLSFEVVRPDGRPSSWGWAVGTSMVIH